MRSSSLVLSSSEHDFDVVLTEELCFDLFSVVCLTISVSVAEEIDFGRYHNDDGTCSYSVFVASYVRYLLNTFS